MSYGTVKEQCPFCKYEETFVFAGHYTLCPNCSAIYTEMMVVEGCEHHKDSALVVSREPWFTEIREKARVETPYVLEDRMLCSKCYKPVNADGW